jgi:hypothetical protein
MRFPLSHISGLRPLARLVYDGCMDGRRQPICCLSSHFTGLGIEAAKPLVGQGDADDLAWFAGGTTGPTGAVRARSTVSSDSLHSKPAAIALVMVAAVSSSFNAQT